MQERSTLLTNQPILWPPISNSPVSPPRTTPRSQTNYHRSSGKDIATLASEAIAWFEPRWLNIESRMEIVPGKQILHGLRLALQDSCGVALTDFRIIDEFSPMEIPKDLQALLRTLDRYVLVTDS